MADNMKYFQGENVQDLTDNAQLLMVIGEMRGQMREMIHTQNNTLQQVQNMAAIVMATAGLPERVAALEKADNLRDGRDGVIAAFTRSPALGWIVGGVSTVVLWLAGKIQL